MRFLFSICFLLWAAGAQAQAGAALLVRGVVTDAETGAGLATAAVSNTIAQQAVFTDDSGHFEISARVGDQLAVSYMGYKSVLLPVVESSAYIAQHVRLRLQATRMQEVIVRPRYTPYQADSIERYATYKRTLLRQHEGSVMSPVTFLAERISHKSKQMFRFQQEFARLENERFIDTRYTPELVAQLTSLAGDTLAFFMNAYPVPYDYARAASELEFKMWIRNNYREWLAKGRPMPEITADTVRR